MAKRVQTFSLTVLSGIFTSFVGAILYELYDHTTLSWSIRAAIFLGTVCIILLYLYIRTCRKLKGKESLIVFYNRSDTPSSLLDELINNTKLSIYIVGITNEDILSSNLYRFNKFLNDGGCLNILMQTDPDLLEKMIVLQYGEKYNRTQLSIAKRNVVNILDNIGNYKKSHSGRVHFRSLSSIIPASYIAFDTLHPSNQSSLTSDNGAIKAVWYQYSQPSEDCPVLYLKKDNSHADLFKSLNDSIRKLWDDGTEIDSNNVEAIKANLE